MMQTDGPMTDGEFGALQDAVRISRDRQVRSLRTLRGLLAGRGHAREDVNRAIRVWADFELRKAGRARAPEAATNHS